MKRDEMISVAQLVKELERFEKDFPNTNVTCCMPDGTLCYAVGIEKDEEGQVCIGFDAEEDSGCFDVEMLLAYLEMYDHSAKVRMEACGLFMTFHIFRDGSYFIYDGNEECVCCDGEAIGEYERQECRSGWHTEAEKRMLSEKARKEKRKSRIEYGALLTITIFTLCGAVYNVSAAVAVSGDSPWKNILYGVICLSLAIISSLTLYYDKQ